MQAKETLFADLMQGRAQQFQVPLYQRTYSWTEKQLRQLWSDILEQAELVASEQSSGASTHFLGSVVLAPSPRYEVTFPCHLVVDGQQRLITLTLALAALRDHVADTHPEEADRINEEYLVNKRKQGTEYFRLLPTQADRAAFAAHIRGPLTQDGAVGGVATAYAFFRRKFVEADEAATGQDVFRIEQAITSRLTLVSVTAERGDNVHRIFESLNNTGLQLSQADLLRNHLFMRLPTRGEHVYETYWLPLQDSLANDELEQLMWLQLVLDGDDRVRRQDLYAAQQRRFERQGTTGETEIEAYIRELHRRGAHLRRLLHPEEEPVPAVRDALHRLDVWQATATHPALMLLLDRRERGDLDNAELARALSYVESFLVRRMICRIPTNNLNRIFQALPGQLPLDVPVADGLRRVLSAENRFWPGDEELRERFRTAPFYQFGRWNQRALVLQRLEESYGHPEPVDFAAAQLTIEHVLPQSPGEEWLRALAEETEEGESPEELHARLRHTLGNLTLTAQNAELSNHPFTRKQDLLDASHLEMNRRIAATERWGAREILARAEELADRAVQLWPAPVRGVGRAERGRDWSLAHQVLAALPHGTWTSYGDVAALLGSSAQAVGQHLAQPTGIVHAYRVLTSEGRIAAGFQWPPGYTGPDVRARLAADGVQFMVTGAADPVQRLTPDDLAALVSDENEDEDNGGANPTETGADRFFRQLAADDSPETVAAVAAILAHWEELGGWIGHGGGTVTTSAFLMLGEAGAPGRGIWPLTLYPGAGRGGTAEVVFQHLSARAPFTDRALRAELLTRLNQLEDVDIPEGKLELRPSFRLTALNKEHNRELLAETLEWFRGCWERRDAS
ncbi:GmrSD restriction endonuclease domain-containing protein [Streptomyces sp. NPDC001661]